MLSVVFILCIALLLAKPMGMYVEKVFSGRKGKDDRLFWPVEKILFRLGGIQEKHQTLKQYISTFLIVNFLMVVLVMAVFLTQGVLPLNPAGVENMPFSLAFNTAVSFMTNTDLQHYSGETGLSYLSQMIGVIFMMFAAPATALSTAIAFIRGLIGQPFGNFYVDFTRAITRILLPISIVAALLFITAGVPQTINGPVEVTTLSGEEQEIARGPVGSFLSIKEVGNNGGGFFGVNSAHPFENPNEFTNALQIILMLLLPMSMPFTYGKMTGNAKQGRVLFVSMFLMLIVMLSISLFSERAGNPLIQTAMEGKEVRFGTEMSALYAVVTTSSETGAVNTMHDTLSPITGLITLTNMMLNTIFGGVGAGFMNVLMYVMIAVFISGLMIGRTPEFLGKKVEAKEMKWIALTLIVQPLLILGGTAIAISFSAGADGISNPGFHGLTQVLYEFTSSAANNGSGFEGLGDATPFWNVSTGIVMLIGRYFAIVAMLIVAGLLTEKKVVPETDGTLHTDTFMFGGIFIGTTILIGALTFFPVLVLGPIAEALTLM